MRVIVGAEKPSLEEVLEHHGVKGMRWGVVRQRLADRGATRAKQKQLNKDSKARDTAARDKQIQAARNRYNNTARTNYLNAKAQFHKDKMTLGSREAKKRLAAVKNKNINDYEIAAQAKSGRESTKETLAIVGLVTLAVALGAISKR